MFQKLRRIQSAPFDDEARLTRCVAMTHDHRRNSNIASERSLPIRRDGHRIAPSSHSRDPIEVPDWPLAAAQPRNVTPWTSCSSIGHSTENVKPSFHQSYRSLDVGRGSRDCIGAQDAYHSGRRSNDNASRSLHSSTSFLATQSDRSSNYQSTLSKQPAALDPCETTLQFNNLEANGDVEDSVEYEGCQGSPLALPIQSNAEQPTMLQSISTPNITNRDFHWSGRLRLSDINRDSSYFHAPNLSPDAQLSPSYSSLPDSPSVRDFDAGWESESQTHAAAGRNSSRKGSLDDDDAGDGTNLGFLQRPRQLNPGFQSYNLPETEQGSTATLRKPQNEPFVPIRDTSASINVQQSVSTWNDGSNHRHLTALDELIDDLGYLGHMIT
ncbi:MAG: hypothetical protein Q9222_002291 [Ikaeria aurantiellina]